MFADFRCHVIPNRATICCAVFVRSVRSPWTPPDLPNFNLNYEKTSVCEKTNFSNSFFARDGPVYPTAQAPVSRESRQTQTPHIPASSSPCPESSARPNPNIYPPAQAPMSRESRQTQPPHIPASSSPSVPRVPPDPTPTYTRQLKPQCPPSPPSPSPRIYFQLHTSWWG